MQGVWAVICTRRASRLCHEHPLASLGNTGQLHIAVTAHALFCRPSAVSLAASTLLDTEVCVVWHLVVVGSFEVEPQGQGWWLASLHIMLCETDFTPPEPSTVLHKLPQPAPPVSFPKSSETCRMGYSTHHGAPSLAPTVAACCSMPQHLFVGPVGGGFEACCHAVTPHSEMSKYIPEIPCTEWERYIVLPAPSPLPDTISARVAWWAVKAADFPISSSIAVFFFVRRPRPACHVERGLQFAGTHPNT